VPPSTNIPLDLNLIAGVSWGTTLSHAADITSPPPSRRYHAGDTARALTHDALIWAPPSIITPIFIIHTVGVSSARHTISRCRHHHTTSTSPLDSGDTYRSSSRILHFRAPPGIIIPFYIIRAVGVSRVTTSSSAAGSIISPPHAVRCPGDTGSSSSRKMHIRAMPVILIPIFINLIAAIPGVRPPSHAAGSIISPPHAAIVRRRCRRDLLMILRFLSVLFYHIDTDSFSVRPSGLP